LLAHQDKELGDERAGGVVGKVGDEAESTCGMSDLEGLEGGNDGRFDLVLAGKHIGVQPMDVGKITVVTLGGGEEFGIDIHGENGSGALGEQTGEVAHAGPNFQNHVLGLDMAGLGDGGQDILIDHEVLAKAMARLQAGGGEDLGDFLAVHGSNLTGLHRAKRS